MRTFTPEEKLAVKNLQVSNSIYRSDIKKLVESNEAMQAELDSLKVREPELLGEEHKDVSLRIAHLESTIASNVGKIAYKQDRIAEKEVKLEAYFNLAAVEEERIIESFDPNSPQRITRQRIISEEAKAAEEDKKAAKRRKK